MGSLVDVVWRALVEATWQLGCVLGPAALCALALHQLERLVAASLMTGFGWRSMLVTGWIGVPVHELSHVAACLAFAHEIEEVKLFSPDPETGTLGFVRHRAPAGNPWAEVGRLAIGAAPLFGGALALYVAARVFLPTGALDTIDPRAAGSATEAFGRGVASAFAMLGALDALDWRAWAFAYVAACVAAHLAPSVDDLGSVARGGAALFVLVFVVDLIAIGFGGVDRPLVEGVAHRTAPLVSLLALAVILSAAVLGLSLALGAVWARVRGDGGHLGRFAGAQWPRLLVLGAIACAWGWLGA